MSDRYAHLGPYWTVVRTHEGVETISVVRAVEKAKGHTFLRIEVTEVHEGDVRDELMRIRVG